MTDEEQENNCEQSWELELDRSRAHERTSAQKLGIDLTREITVFELCMRKDHSFFLRWKEPHPEMLDVDEFFNFNNVELHRAEELDELDEEARPLMEQWLEANTILPATSITRELTQREAYELLASYCLPPVFHKMAGVKG